MSIKITYRNGIELTTHVNNEGEIDKLLQNKEVKIISYIDENEY